MSICSMVEGECCAGEAGRRIMLLLLSCGAGEVTSRWLSHSIASVEGEGTRERSETCGGVGEVAARMLSHSIASVEGEGTRRRSVVEV